MKPTLNLGCGNDKRGTVRIDMNPARSARTIIADAHFIPLRDKAISKTLCKSVLEHVGAPIKVLLEMKRITVEDIIIIVPNLMNLERMIRGLKNPLKTVNENTLHLQGWDPKLIRHLANAARLNIQSVRWGSEKSHRLSFIFKRLLSTHMIVYMKDTHEELCSKCGNPKKRFWCEPDFTYCPKCDVEFSICENNTRALARGNTD